MAAEARRPGRTDLARSAPDLRGGCYERRASASATASDGLFIAAMPSTASPPRASSHVPSPTTGRPALRPSAISLRVPHAPPIATIASAARTTSALRASPSPVGTATWTQPLASPRSSPGSSPTVIPPRERAPRHAASITPKSPPQTSTALAAAIPAPTSSAAASSSALARPGPTTAIHGASGGTVPSRPTAGPLADDEVDELARHDDDLDDLLAVDLRLQARRARERLELLARRSRRGLYAVAPLAVDLHDQLDRVALEHRRVRVGPRLLPHALARQRLVDLRAAVRGEREDQRGGGGGAELQRGRGDGVAAAVALVDELHDGGDRRVEREAPGHVVRHLVDRPVRLAHELEVLAVGRVQRPARRPRLARLIGDVHPQPPQAPEEPVDALDALVGPVRVLVGRADEEDVAARGVRPVALDVADRADHVALGLGHLRPVAGDHALGEEPQERLLEVEQVHVRQRLDEEAGVHQVQDRVLDAADVLVDRHPSGEHAGIPRSVVVARVAVAQEVPGRVDEGVHRVRLAQRATAAPWAVHVEPVLGGGQWRAALGGVVAH